MQQIKYNKENPNGVLVDLTAEELANNETAKKEAEQKNLAEQQAKTQKEADALAGNNKLLELGLTQAQVTAMTGYTPPVSE
jgi:arsenate reductase-like glutaredoxin family protein